MDKYIGISEDRLHHIIGVARKAYQLAKSMDCDEDFARKMFMVGWVHDVGYEFSKEQAEHPGISSEMLHQRRRAGSSDFCKSWEECPI